MKFYALVILPLGTQVYDVPDVEAATAALMKPFEMWQDDRPPGEWDYYWCCTRDGLKEHGEDVSQWPTALADTEHLVVPVDTVTANELTYAVVTPQQEWFNSKATHTAGDPTWPDRALGVCRRFAGHHAVLVFCHG